MLFHGQGEQELTSSKPQVCNRHFTRHNLSQHVTTLGFIQLHLALLALACVLHAAEQEAAAPKSPWSRSPSLIASRLWSPISMYFSAIQPHASASQPAIFAMDLRLGCHPHTSNSSRSFRPRRSSKTDQNGLIRRAGYLSTGSALPCSGLGEIW